jgi:hypothetical protein
MKRSVEAAESAAKSAENQGKLSYMEERAWLGPSHTYLKTPRPLKPGEQTPRIGDILEARVSFENTGKTPALLVQIASDGTVAPIERGPQGQESVNIKIIGKFQDKDYQLGGNIPPGGKIYRDIAMWPNPVTRQNVIDLNKPSHRGVIYGRGEYCDVVNPNITHWFTFFYVLKLPGDPEFVVYPKYNDLGDENKPCHGK